MSQELAQDEAEADAEDYEIDTLENGHRRLATHDDDDEFVNGGEEGDEGQKMVKGGRGGGMRGEVGEENVVFAMGEDSDDDEDGRASDGGERRGNGYRDDDENGDGVERKGS